MGKETSKIALNAHVHLRTVNQQMSRPERHVDDITDMRRSCRLRKNTSGRRPLGLSTRLLKVPILLSFRPSFTAMREPSLSGCVRKPWKQLIEVQENLGFNREKKTLRGRTGAC